MFKILVVDDDEFFRDAMAELLEEQDWSVTVAKDGKAAYEIVEKVPAFDLIISDIRMPRYSGVELLAWVMENKPTPVILMTGFAMSLETDKARKLGALHLLDKPFDSASLIATIKSLTKPAA